MRLLKNLSFRVLVAIAAGVLVGALWPAAGKALQPVGETFINLIRMLIAPLVFFTIVIGVGSMGSMKKVGRVGGKALLYFEIVTTFALFIGVGVANILKPGQGVVLSALERGDASQYTSAVHTSSSGHLDWVSFITHIVPTNVVDAFARGDILQVLLFAILFGFGVTAVGEKARPVLDLFDRLTQVLFKVLGAIMKLAPLGAFGAMAFTVGKYGLATLLPLGKLMLSVYATMFLFVFVVLGGVCRLYHFRLLVLLRYIRQEIVVVLGTSSSEAVLPSMLEKMERFGCSRSVVGLVIPTGYSFNLDGTTIYLSMAALFLAQAFQVKLSVGQQLSLIFILMVTSKGAAAVTGGGFIVLASTLTAMKVIPVEGLALLLGVDRFMSEARAIVNLIGNAVATAVVARSENEFDEARYQKTIYGIGPDDEPAAPVAQGH